MEPEEREHLIAALAELVSARGWQTFVLAPILLPTSQYFPDRWSPDLTGVWCVAKRLLGYAELSGLELDVEIFADASVVARESGGLVHATGHTSAAAWFAGIEDGVCLFGANASQLDDGFAVAASMAHEAAHAYRHAHQLEHDDRDLEEQLTDLTTVYLGFGLLTANASSRHRSWNPAGDVFVSTASYSSLGYLSPDALSFLLACQAAVRGRDPIVERALEMNQAASYKRSLAWLRENAADLDDRLGIPPRTAWPEPPSLASRLRPITPPAETTGPSELVAVAPEHPSLSAARVPHSRALGFTIAGAFIGFAMTLVWLVVLGLPGAALGYGTLAFAVAGGFFGHRHPLWYCSYCDTRLIAGAATCRTCGRELVRTLRRPSDRLDEPHDVDDSDQSDPRDLGNLDGSALPRQLGVVCVSNQAERTGPFEIEKVQRHHDVVLPSGYAHYLATLGSGTDSGVVGVWSPARIALERGAALDWIGRHEWDAADALVDLDPRELVLVGDTCDGDRIAFHPRYPKHVLWLRIDVAEIVDLGTEFLAAVDEICDLDEREIRWFAPPSVESRLSFVTRGGVTLAELIDRILEFGAVRLQPEPSNDDVERWIVLAPAIGGTVRLHATPERGWDLEIASDAANVDAARRLAAALST